jgi:hypothetical protein
MSVMLVSKSSFRAPPSSACIVEYDSTTIGDSVLNSNYTSIQDLYTKTTQIEQLQDDVLALQDLNGHLMQLTLCTIY